MSTKAPETPPETPPTPVIEGEPVPITQEAYDHAISIRDAKIAELSSDNSKAEETISTLKAANYDLVMKGGTPVDVGATPNATPDDKTETITLSDLFEKKGK